MKNFILIIILTIFTSQLHSQFTSGLHVEEGLNVVFGKDDNSSSSRLIWLDTQKALRWGLIDNSLSATLIGDHSTAWGINTRAEEDQSTAWGDNTISDGIGSTTWGFSTFANDDYSTAFGEYSIAEGDGATAWGMGSEALNPYSTSWGEYSVARGSMATAFGRSSRASGISSTAFGHDCTAIGENSTAFGENTEASGINSLALGIGTFAVSPSEVVLGSYNKTNIFDRLFVIGNGTPSLRSDAFVVRMNGNSTFYASKLEVENSSGSADLIINGTSGTSAVEFQDLGNFQASMGWDDTPKRLFFFQGGNAMFIKNGKVGIGAHEAVTNDLEVGGNASKASAGSWLGNSDKRLKKNINILNSNEMLEKVLEMKGVSYEWDDDKTGLKRPAGIQIGFIAQDLEEVWPSKIDEDANGYLQTAYGDYDPVFVEAIKAQQQLIKELSEKLKLMEQKNESLESRLIKIESSITN